MRNLCSTLLQASNASTQTSQVLDAGQLISISAHTIQGDSTMAGSVKIQASNDPTPQGAQHFTPTNWVDIPSVTASITAGAPVLLTISQSTYRWLRVVVTVTTPGSSTMTVNINALSV